MVPIPSGVDCRWRLQRAGLEPPAGEIFWAAAEARWQPGSSLHTSRPIIVQCHICRLTISGHSAPSFRTYEESIVLEASQGTTFFFLF